MALKNKKMLKFGIVTEVIPSKGMVRVGFEEDGIVSFLLPVLMKSTKEDKYFHSLAVNERVVCLMDEFCENGVVIGAIYDASNIPDSTSGTVTQVVFSDDTKVQYDRSTTELIVEVGDTLIKANNNGIEVTRNGASLKDILKKIVNTAAATQYSGSNTPPLNIVDINLILPEIEKLFS